MFFSYAFAGRHCSQYEMFQQFWRIARKQKKKRKTPINNSEWTWEILPIRNASKMFWCIARKYKKQKETVKQFWMNLGNISVTSLKESLKKWTTSSLKLTAPRIVTFVGYLVRSRKQFHGPNQHSFKTFFQRFNRKERNLGYDFYF